MEKEIYENYYKDCEYCEVVYYESDTGYTECGCSLITGNEIDCGCVGGELEDGCPLSFEYQIEKDE